MSSLHYITLKCFQMFHEGVQASRSHCAHSSNSHLFQVAQFCKLHYLAWDEWTGAQDWFLPQKDASSKGWSWEKLKRIGTAMCVCCAKARELSPLMGAAGLWHLPLLKQVSQKCHLASCQLNDAWCLSSLLSAPLLSSSLFEPGMARNGRNCFRTV